MAEYLRLGGVEQLPLRGFEATQRPLVSGLGRIMMMGQVLWQMLSDPFPKGKYWMENKSPGLGVTFTKVDPIEIELRGRGLKI